MGNVYVSFEGYGKCLFFLLRPIDHSWATIVIGPNDKASFPVHLLIYAAARQDGSVLDKKTARSALRIVAVLHQKERKKKLCSKRKGPAPASVAAPFQLVLMLWNSVQSRAV